MANATKPVAHTLRAADDLGFLLRMFIESPTAQRQAGLEAHLTSYRTSIEQGLLGPHPTSLRLQPSGDRNSAAGGRSRGG